MNIKSKLYLYQSFNFIIIFFELTVKEKEKETLDQVQKAKAKIRKEIGELRDRLKLAQDNMQLLKEKIDTEDLVVEEAL